MTMNPEQKKSSTRRQHLAALGRTSLAMAASALPLGPAFAQAYPSRPIKVIVTNAPGSLTDVVARQVLIPLGKVLGQSIVVDNIVGAGGIVGTESVVRAAPDGYTLGMVPGTHAILPALYKLSYDPVKSITPIAIVATSPLVLVVSPKITSRTPQEFIALSKSRPDGVTLGSPGVGTAIHLASELMAGASGMKWLHVPYKANSGLMTDLLGGQVDAGFLGAGAAMPLVKAGKLRAIAVTSAQRQPLLPDVPTLAEVGMPGASVDVWVALIGPAGLPADITRKLNQDMQRALADKGTQDYLREQNVDVVLMSQADTVDTFQKDVVKFAKVVKDAGIKGQ